MSTPATNAAQVWPHRLAIGLVCATFPLIWVGGLVTTYQAGMAVPDWPSTFGYNLFLYPWQTWLFGPWDLFIEHGHRLLGAFVGLLTIGLLGTLLRNESRRWVVRLGWLALATVVFQGVLGGMRVLLDEKLLAKLHGCTGPLFFALTATLAVVTSRGWLEMWNNSAELPVDWRAPSLLMTLLAYVQIVLGANLRHLPADLDRGWFQGIVWLHLAMALALVVQASGLAARGWRDRVRFPHVARPALVIGGLLVVQVLLGASTWVVNYSWPVWMQGWSFAAGYVVRHESLLQAYTTTAHVALGSLILATSLVLALRVLRSTSSGAGLFKSSRWVLAGGLA